MNQRQIRVYRDLIGENEIWAEKTRELLAANKVLMLNLIGSPGCGKTALLAKTSSLLPETVRLAVLAGDVDTTKDAERLKEAGVTVSQLLSGGACHLEAKLVHHALRDLPLDSVDVVVVENVGNLVCPAEFDIGESAKVAVLSVTEGEEKPLKYPLLFRESALVLLSKIDLMPHLSFDIGSCQENIRQVNAHAPILRLSSVAGTGMGQWVGWVETQAGR